LRAPCDALAAALPNARLVVVEGGHMITPANPRVIGFIQEVVAERGPGAGTARRAL
jgi:hypothetical protein